MKAVRLHGYHQQPVVEEVPEPTVKGPLDVVVKIGGAGVCRTDLHIIVGQWAEAMGPTLPYTIGHENAGWVHEVGSAVTNVAVGDTVILHPTPTCGLCRACRAGQDMHCANSSFPGLDSDGGMAEYLLTSARACVKLDPATAAARTSRRWPTPASRPTTRCARRSRCCIPARPACVIGAGGLGHIGIQCLAALTATNDHRGGPQPGCPEARRAARRAAHGGRRRRPGRRGEGPDRTAGRRRRPRLRRRGGCRERRLRDDPPRRLVLRHRLRRHRSTIPTLDIISTERNIIGNIVGTYNELAELMVLAQTGKVTLHTSTYPLDAAVEALQDLDAGRVRGRAILVP